MFGFIPISTTYIFGTLLTANGSIKELNIMAAIGMVLNVTLNIILIPKFQAEGAAIVSLSTQVVTASAQVAIAMKIFKLKPKWSIISRIVLFSVLLVLLGYSSRYIENKVVGYLALIGISTVFAFVTKLIDLKTLISIVMNKD
jgi:O-antigen/teichoic acid export membrane protein